MGYDFADMNRYLDESDLTLGEWALVWGGAFDELDAEHFTWREVECYPVERLLNGSHVDMNTREQWATWLEGEAEDMPEHYIDELAEAWLERTEDFEPVILVEFRDGTWDIGDGWHRIGISIVEGIACVPAVVGVER